MNADALQAILHAETIVDPFALSPPPPRPTKGSSSGHAVDPYSSSSSRSSPSATTPLSPPFLPSNTASAPSTHLPYHWLELAELLLAHAADDIRSASEVRSLLKDIQEARAAKLRAATAELGRDGGAGGVLSLRGIGAMELAEARAFVKGVVDGVRLLGASAEMTRREDELERQTRDGTDYDDNDDYDDDMAL